MTHDLNAPGRARSKARPQQHISSIAHLFFDNNDAEQSAVQTSDMTLLVVGTGRDTCAPYTAVGLGQNLLDQSGTVDGRGTTKEALPTRQVYFAEPSPVCFSGVSHLQKNSFRPPTNDEPVPWPLRPGMQLPVLRLFPGDVPSEDFSGGIMGGRCFIRHLDLPREAELNALETLIAAGRTTGLADSGVEHLIWCVPASVAVSLSLVGRLGRLLRIVNNPVVHLVLFPEQGKGSSRTSSEPTEALLNRSRRLVEYVADGAVVHGVLMGESPEERALQLASLSRKLST